LVEIAGAEVADSLVSITGHPSANVVALRRELETLGSEVRASPEIARLFFDSSADLLFQALSSSPDGQLFLDKLVQRARLLGDRAMQEFELSAPRWSEDPRPLLVALRALVVGGSCGQGSLAAQVGPDRQTDLTTLLSHVSPLRRWLLRRVHRAFVTYIRLREETKAVLATCFAEIRRRYLVLGARLHTDGLVAQEEDIFFLSLDEVREVLADRPTGRNYRDSISKRRAIYADYEAHRSSPTSEVVAEGGSTLSGTPVSGGRVTGRARIVLYPSLSSLQQGEIIVTESTDPGWMPLFLVAGAIVTEIGGMLSHTATLARELNKPAVFSVVGATRLIRDGQLITVDGGQGQVYIHTEEALL
jgi:pyruvate,water dikinase